MSERGVAAYQPAIRNCVQCRIRRGFQRIPNCRLGKRPNGWPGRKTNPVCVGTNARWRRHNRSRLSILKSNDSSPYPQRSICSKPDCMITLSATNRLPIPVCPDLNRIRFVSAKTRSKLLHRVISPTPYGTVGLEANRMYISRGNSHPVMVLADLSR